MLCNLPGYEFNTKRTKTTKNTILESLKHRAFMAFVCFVSNSGALGTQSVNHGLKIVPSWR
jgi:hypothetical protein